MYSKLLTLPSGTQRPRLFPLRRVVRISTAVICAGLLAIAGALLWQARLRSLATAEGTTNNLVGILTQHTERTFDSVDMLLKIVAGDLGLHADDPVRLSTLDANLTHLARDLPHVMAVRLLDANAEEPLFEFFRARPTGRSHDREALEVHGANKDLGLHVGRPFFDETSNTWAVGISRRVGGLERVPPGRVVLALLNLEYLNNFYQSIDMGPDASISLIRTDGIMIARRPFDPSYLGRDVSKALFPCVGSRDSGNYEIRALTDGVTRTYGFQRLKSASIIVTAGLSQEAILAVWSQEAQRGMAIAGIAALLILLAGEMLARVASHRDRMERELLYAANHDALTGLSNRMQFQRHVDHLLDSSPAEPFCLLLLDIDEFKNVNDTLGHAAGDALLRESAARLTQIADSPTSIGRLGGDEFAITVRGTLTEGLSVAGHILENFRQPFEYNRQTLMTAASIGITAFPLHGSGSGDLMKNADLALYAAKTGGRNRSAVFEHEMGSEICERIALHEDVRIAAEADRFVPYYQPQLCVRTGNITGFEALARWRHPERGLLTPAVFGSAFENHDLAIDIGRRLFRQILADMRDWSDQGLPFGRIAVNASAAELDDPTFSGWALHALQEAGLPSSMLEIEVTEGVLFGKTFERVQTNLLRLHKAGIRIALDDFGTGYASLTHLKQFPIGVLKIDRSFIHNVENNAADASIVTAVIDMAHGLNIDVVAEGVERPYQLDLLRRIGCTYAQGYLFAKPMAGSRVPAFLRAPRNGPGPELYEATA